jgi:hypothetical protein
MPTIPTRDRDILRFLAEAVAEAAAHPANAENDRAWRRLNALDPAARPLVWINEIPWGEMNVDGELDPQCETPFCQGIEGGFRRTLYQWQHLRGHMIVEPIYYCPLAIRDTGFGIRQEGVNSPTGPVGSIASQEFDPQIKDVADVGKIKIPEVSHDEAASAEHLETVRSLFGDILEVRPRGVAHQWFTLWDNLIRWYGVQEAMMDFILNPDLVHAALQRLLDACMARLDQQVELGLLSPTNGAMRVGSGGYACTDELPETDGMPGSVGPGEQWGCANAQILSEVSPEMHEEFSLRYDRQWLARFGLAYYGCCEPLHLKMGILKSIPNLRKVSMSAWADPARMAEEGNGQYVLSFKPNPAIFASEEKWHPDWARRELVDMFEKTRGSKVEIIMKDISTVSCHPERLWEWADLAVEVADQFA